LRDEEENTLRDPIEEFLAHYSPDVQAISQSLRAMVTSAMPQVQEVLYARHNHFGYSFSGLMSERICYLCPMKDYVRLGFVYGAQPPDPEHRLEGTGKRLRHVKVRTLKEASHPALKRLVKAAWADAKKQMKEKKG